jgi:cytosine/adenosine deaminase-related metal-dependent hydrolase
LNPAVFLGTADSIGRVDSGYVADLVLLEGNPLSDIHNTRRIAGSFGLAGFYHLQFSTASAASRSCQTRA